MVTKAALHDKGKVSDSYHRVQALLHYLNLNYGKKIDSNLIEWEFNCNFDYLNKVFKANMGKTIFLYLNEIRMHHAMELLSTTSMKISAVAHRVGYEDEGYFGKVFRKYTGVTPGQPEQFRESGLKNHRKRWNRRQHQRLFFYCWHQGYD